MSIAIKLNGEYVKPTACIQCGWLDRYAEKCACAWSSKTFAKDFDIFCAVDDKCPFFELVECKDCKRFKPIANGYGECIRQGATLTVKNEDFCSAGERK